MKNKPVRTRLNEVIRPGTTSAVLMVCGYWISQALALYFVGGSICGLNSKICGVLYLAVFAFFFFIHFSNPWSKLAAFFGLCSLAVVAFIMMYIHFTFFNFWLPSAESLLLFAGALIFAGVILDAEKYRTWAASHHQRLKLAGAPGSPAEDMANYI